MLSIVKKLKLHHFLIIVLLVIPIICIVVFELLVVSNRYESLATIYITEENSEVNPFDLSSIGLSGSAGSNREILVLKSYIESQSMMEKLDKDLHILDHFSSSHVDFFSRLKPNAEREFALEYYNERITAELDVEAKLLQLSVQTFDPEFSKKVLERILVHSQEFIDKLNENVSRSQLVFLEGVVKNSEEDLMQETKNLQDFQNKNKIFSTELTSKSIVETIAGLEQRLAANRAQLSARKGSLDENAPTIIRLRAEIDALEQQIKLENDRLAGGDKSSLSELDTNLREIRLRIEYKTLRYKAHLEAFEKAQLETARRMRFLTIVSGPTMPEASLYPDRGYAILTGSILSLMVYFFISISVAVIREHA
ncbi:hypothetical protein [uncultured Cohaesibacter sp.]|uniref:hypothetical protein n=1 Tax=uncultured Cohaesibacter sp. TaxID=1002546 RepID=UPI0029C85FE5|nr:hypothetical protein [uncultured Cohaesibacter sp.]